MKLLVDGNLEIEVDTTTLDSNIVQVIGWLDCECEDNMITKFDISTIKTGEEEICEKCGAIFDNVPNSRLNEILHDYYKGILKGI